MKKIILMGVLFIAITNISDSFRQIILGFLGADNVDVFYYTNVNGEHTSEETVGFVRYGGNTFEEVLAWSKRWNECHPTFQDKTLYRTFAMKPWQFWMWINYFTHPRWDLPYIDGEKIKPFLGNRTPSICSEPFSLK